MTERHPITDLAIKLYQKKELEVGREAEVERIAVAICGKPQLWKEMGWPEVTNIRCQVQLGGSRADILIEHTDKSVTLIEVKPGGLALRDYCTGIGQLAYQAIMAVSVFQTYCVRRALCLPGPIPPDLYLASLFADIDFLPVPTPEQWHVIGVNSAHLIAGTAPKLADAYTRQ